MEKAIILSPEELYYMGKLLQAKYIDYAYIAAMDDIGNNYPLFEKETKASLVSSGVVLEDFSGNLEIDKDVLSMLKPIFFGDEETSIEICALGEMNAVSVNKFHFLDGIITMVTNEDRKLAIKEVDQLFIHDFVARILDGSYNAEQKLVEDIDKEKVNRIIAVKSIVVGRTAEVKTFVEAGRIVYRDKLGEIESMTTDMFISDVYETVKGV